jgi:5'-nucleotidase
MRKRSALSLIVTLVLAATPAAALDILLTNDDGFAAVGIQTLKAALAGAGHNVTMVAPMAERSGSSAAINLTPVTPVQVGAQDFGLIALEEVIGEEDRKPIPATPATCVLFGLSVVLDGVDPDLVVAGTNVGANVGTAVPFSGTVGATTAALAGGVPALAFSSDEPDVEEDDPAFAAHYANVAAFAVEFIAHLESKPGVLGKESGLLPPDLALNINYPTVDPKDVKGVKLTVQGQASSASLVFQPIGDDIFIPAVGPGSGDGKDVANSDTAALEAGYITVTPIHNDMTARTKQAKQLRSILKGL